MEKDIAAYIKKEFDGKHNPTWHCVVGRNFGEQLAPAERRSEASPRALVTTALQQHPARTLAQAGASRHTLH